MAFSKQGINCEVMLIIKYASTLSKLKMLQLRAEAVILQSLANIPVCRVF
jgi:hypothetical protein